MEQHQPFYEYQFGFRPKHSTIHPIIHLLNQIANENDKSTQNLTLSVFIDLTKAFDTISHSILLKKLDNLGIRGVANKWFKSYLTDRKQYMNFGNSTSPYEQLLCGIPQGSILGPILFLIYVNDIQNATSMNMLSFADDTTASISSPDITELYATINVELEKLNNWFRANKLSLNAKKTKHILFRANTAYPNLQNRSIILNGHKVDRIGHNQAEKNI